ncbi:MAG: hypothetical protein SNJ78_02330 [Spirochaetales bacterium]
MKCEEVIEAYLSLDQGESLCTEALEHLKTCSSCQKTLSQMEGVLTTYRKNLEIFASPDFESRVLAAIIEKEQSALETKWKHISDSSTLTPTTWLIPGVLLFLGILGIPFSSVFSVFSTLPGRNLELVVPLVLGSALTVYAALFIISNLEWLCKKFLS